MASKLSAFFFLVVFATCASAQTMITTCQGLQDMNLDLAGNYALANDIDCSTTSGWNSGAGFAPVGTPVMPFTGSLSSKGFVIANLKIVRADWDNVGLFGYLDEAASITLIALQGISISGRNNVGGLAGTSYGAINASYTAGSVEGASFAGGLIGSHSGRLTLSFSDASVMTTGDVAGGLVGEHFGLMNDCYATGDVRARNHAGGLAGLIHGYSDRYALITNSYAVGQVASSTGTAAAGLVNLYYMSSHPYWDITESYWDTCTTNQPASVGGEGKNTKQMRKYSTFSTWDFKAIWWINKTHDYPKLRFSLTETYPPIHSKNKVTVLEVLMYFVAFALGVFLVFLPKLYKKYLRPHIDECLRKQEEKRRREAALLYVPPPRTVSHYVPPPSTTTAYSPQTYPCGTCNGVGNIPRYAIGPGGPKLGTYSQSPVTCLQCGGTGKRTG